jgi:hypothetical protein
MTAGLPGTGIGGLFYLISAVLMPFRELWRASTGRGNAEHMKLALRQFTMASLIFASAYVTGWVLTAVHVASTTKELNMLVITFGTLTAVLVAVEGISASLKVGAWIAQQLSGQAPASGGDR